MHTHLRPLTPQRAPHAPHASHATGYIMIPRRLISAFARTPAAIGIWMLIASQYFLHKQSVPLSVHDIQRYDPRLCTGAITRALQTLGTQNWLHIQPGTGCKNQYTPSWGVINGVRHDWDHTADGLGRPRHLATIRLDRRLLDVCVGRIDVCASGEADIERYTNRPMLSLSDIGSYALLSIGHATTTPALAALALVHNGQPCALSDTTTILATVSQQPLLGTSDLRLSDAGARYLGLPTAAAPSPARGQTLAFLEPGLIESFVASMIGNLIGSADPLNVRPSAAERAETPVVLSRANDTGIKEDQEDQESKNLPQTPLVGESNQKSFVHDQVDTRHITGHASVIQGDKLNACPAAPSASAAYTERDKHHLRIQGFRTNPLLPDTDTARALDALGVMPTQIRELADLPCADVQQIIAASCTPGNGVRCPAGWVVERLREVRKGHPIDTLIAATTRHISSNEWVQQYYAAAQPYTVVASRSAEQATEEQAAAPWLLAAGAHEEKQRTAVVPDPALTPDPALLKHRLRHMVPQLRNVIDRLDIQVTATAIMLSSPDPACYNQLQRQLGFIRLALRDEAGSKEVMLRVEKR